MIMAVTIYVHCLLSDSFALSLSCLFSCSIMSAKSSFNCLRHVCILVPESIIYLFGYSTHHRLMAAVDSTNPNPSPKPDFTTLAPWPEVPR